RPHEVAGEAQRELAPVVPAEGPDGAMRLDGKAMLATRAHGDPPLTLPDRRGHPSTGCFAEAELTVVVGPPAPQRPVRFEREAVPTSRADGDPIGVVAHAFRPRPRFIVVAETELPFGVASPSPERPVRLERKTVVV